MRRPSPASVLALLLVVGTGVWLGWYAYRGELRSLISATPTFEIDMPAPPVAPSVDVASDSSVPSITIDIPPEKPPAPVTVATATIPPVAATPVAKAPVAVPPHTSLAASSLAAAPAAPAAAPPHTSLASVPMVTPATPPHASLSSVLAMATPPEVPPPAAPLPSQAPQPPLAIFPVQGIKPAPTTPVVVSPLASVTLPPAAPPKMTAVPMSAAPAAQPQEASLPPEPLEAPPPPELRPAGLQPSQPASVSLADASLAPAIGTNASAPAVTGAVVPLTPGTKQASVIDSFMPPGMNQQDLPAWQRYARPFDAKDPRPRIAIIITKLGLLHGATAAAIDKLPADVTLSFSPYALDLPEWMAHARTLGHEIMLDLPMDSNLDGSDPGPEGMMSSLSTAENLQRLDWILGRGDSYVGLAGVLGDRFTASPVELRPVLRAIGKHGLLFLDPWLTNASVASAEATKLRVPRAIADLTIDNAPDRVSIDQMLAELEHRARITGFAVGLANGFPVTIERLNEWSQGLPAKNLALAPVSAIVDQQADR